MNEFSLSTSFFDYTLPEESFYAQDMTELRGFSLPQRTYLFFEITGMNDELPFDLINEYGKFMPRSVALVFFSRATVFNFEDLINSSMEHEIRAELRQERLRWLYGGGVENEKEELLRWEKEEEAWQLRLQNLAKKTSASLKEEVVASVLSHNQSEENLFSFDPDEEEVQNFFNEDNSREYWNDAPEWIQEEVPFEPDLYDEILQSAIPDVYDESHLEALNPEQRAAAEQMEGFALVVAGPGTGKTKTLVSHVVHLVKNGVPPRRIGLVTFTNKAAKEMRERAETMYPPSSRVWCGTFHSLAFKLLREYNSRLGILTERELRPALLSHALSLYGEADKELKDMLLDSPSRLKQYHELDSEDRVDTLTEWRTMAQAKLTEEEQEGFLKIWTEYKIALENISSTFIEWKLKYHKMEFDDLVPAASLMIQKGEIFGLTEKISFEHFNMFDHLCVDEYQDTSSDQSELVALLTRKMSNLFIVGDDAQSIYEWRNASADYMLEMANENPNKVFRLETNYRSTSSIVDQVNSSLKSISHRIDKTLRPAFDKETGETIRGKGVTYCPTTFASSDRQGLFLANTVQEHIKNKGKASDWAFLFRTHKRGGSIDLQHHLRRLKIPFVVVGGSPVYKEFPAIQMLSYMQLSLNICDEIALKTLLQELPGIAELTAGKITRGFFKWLKVQKKDGQIPRASLFSTWMISLDGKKTISSRAQKSPYFTVMHDTFALIDYEDPQTIMDISDRWCRLIMEDLQEKQGKKKGISNSSGSESFVKLVRVQLDDIKKEMLNTGDSSDVQTFIDNILMNERQQKEHKDEKNVVTLTTVHSAKGLEWPIVCCPDMNEGVFPSGRWKEAVQRRLRKEMRNGMFKKQPGLERELQLMLNCVKTMEKNSEQNFFFTLNNSIKTEINVPEKFFVNFHEQLSLSELYTISGEGKFSFGSNRQITKMIKILERMENQNVSLTTEETDFIIKSCEKINKIAETNKNVSSIQIGSFELMRQPLLDALRPITIEVTFSSAMKMFFEMQFEKMLDEERRLFYVAISRAMDVLLLTRPGEIFIPGEGPRNLKESCYLNVLKTKDCPEYPTFEILRKIFGEQKYVAPFDPSSFFDDKNDILMPDLQNVFNKIATDGIQEKDNVQKKDNVEEAVFGIAQLKPLTLK